MSAPVTAEELAEAARIERMGEILPASRAVDLMHRLARDLAAERARAAEIEADRDALAAKIETMLRDEEDARALRIAEHASREDVAGKLEALRAAVRAHEAAAKGDPSRLVIAAERMWAAAKA